MLRWLTSFSYIQYTVAGLVGLFVLSGASYGYFLQKTINTVVERNQVKKEITQLRSRIGDAEQDFGAEVGSATMERARKLGFKQTNQLRYITRSAGSATLLTANVQRK
jgi:hypothetical protein